MCPKCNSMVVKEYAVFKTGVAKGPSFEKLTDAQLDKFVDVRLSQTGLVECLNIDCNYFERRWPEWAHLDWDDVYKAFISGNESDE